MKRRLISPTDLARIAPLNEDQQRIELQKLKDGHPPFNYNPIRKRLADIFNLRVGQMFEPRELNWEQIRRGLIQACRTKQEAKYNLMAAEGLNTFAKSNGLTGRREEDGFDGMSLGLGLHVSLWEKAIVIYNGRPHIVFIDLRGSKHLTGVGRKFAFSAQHVQIREQDPDLEDAGLLILHVQPPQDGIRTVKPYTDEGVELFSYEELNDMTKRTYEIWNEIQFGRQEETRRRAAGNNGPLFS